MNSGKYSMKHIGITIVISLIVLVLVSPLLRPKAALPASRIVTPEMREIAEEYRKEMARIAEQAAMQHGAGTLSLFDLLAVRMKADQVAIESFALALPSGHGGNATHAVVTASYTKQIMELRMENFKAGILGEPIDWIDASYRSRLGLAQQMAEMRDNKAFLAACAAWEQDRSGENLKKMFDAEMNL